MGGGGLGGRFGAQQFGEVGLGNAATVGIVIRLRVVFKLSHCCIGFQQTSVQGELAFTHASPASHYPDPQHCMFGSINEPKVTSIAFSNTK